METDVATSRTQRLVDDALAALAELNHADATFRPSEELATLAQAAPKLRSMIDAYVVGTMAAAEQASAHRNHGARTLSQFVADRAGCDPKKVRADLRLGRWLADFSQFTEAWGNGTLLRDHLELIRHSVHNGRTHGALVRDQHLFIEWADQLDFSDYEACCRYWVLAADPDGAEPKEQVASSYVRGTKRGDGMVKVNALLDPLAGHAFLTAHRSEEQALFRAEADEALASTAASAAQRSVNAFMNLVNRGASRTESAAAAPLVNIVLSESVAEAMLDRIDHPSSDPLPIAFDDIDARCETIDGTPLHPNFVLATLGTATFRRQIMGADSRIIDVSVNARCFTPWQKQALAVQARGRCRRRGCDAPFSWLEADHVEAHSRGGPTRLDNGQLLCRPHNQAKGSALSPS